MKSLTASDRQSLIRLASSLPKGDKSRRAILVGLKSASIRTAYMSAPKDFHGRPGETPVERLERIIRDYPGRKRAQIFQRIVEDAMPKYGIDGYEYIDKDIEDLEDKMVITQTTAPGGYQRKPDPKKSDEDLLGWIKWYQKRPHLNVA